MKSLTEAEYKIWVGQQVAGNIPLYNMGMSYRIRGTLDAQKFSNCFRQLVRETEVLHSVIKEYNNEPQWISVDAVPADLAVKLNTTPPSEEDLQFFLEKLASTTIDLTRHIYSSMLIQVSVDDWIWFFNIHHIAIDATSFQLLFNRMQVLYTELPPATELENCEFPLLPRPLRSSTAEQIEDGDTRREPLVLYHDQNIDGGYRSIRFDLPIETVLKATQDNFAANPLMKNLQLTCMHIVVLCCVLHRLSGKSQVSIAVPIHNRSTASRRNAIGLLMDVANLEIKICGTDTPTQLLDSVTQQLIDAYGNASSNSRIEKTRNSKAIVNFLAVPYEDFLGMPTHVDWIDSGFMDKEHLARLQVIYFNDAKSPEIKLDVNVSSFPQQRQRDLVDFYQSHAKEILQHPSKSIEDMSLQSRPIVQSGQLVPISNVSMTIWDHLERLNSHYGDESLLECEGETLTCAECHNKALHFAAALHDNGVRPGQLIGIDTTRSLHTVIAILGAIRLGALFVPIDHNLPRHRRDQILTQISAWNNGVAQVVFSTPGKSTHFERDPWSLADNYAQDDRVIENLPHPPVLSDGCYVLFTSGTTGEPKGVEVNHVSLLNYLDSVDTNIAKSRRLTYALFSALHFDLTLTSLFLPIVTAGKLIIFPQQNTDGPDLSVLSAISDPRINLLKATPAHLEACDDTTLRNSSITDWILGGEALRTSLCKRITKLSDGRQCNIYNEYGPTEATIGCMIHQYDINEDKGLDVPIGSAIQKVKIYILDTYLQPVPAMVRGQIYIGGENLAEGYLGKPELTNEKFIASPFSPGERIYATGDSAIIDDSGLVHYLGRIDQQLKLQGVRIEAGEIESEIVALDSVESAAVCKVKREKKNTDVETVRCERCGIPSHVPGIRLNDIQLCNICLDYSKYKTNVDSFFGTPADFSSIVAKIKRSENINADCIALFSGGKDSTYMLYRLVEAGLTPLVFTLDNGFISEQAKQNIERVVTDLKLEHVFATTPGMNEIFAESLTRFSDVCNGCFKTIYTLSTKLALERGIGSIFTGLSSGQLVDTRLGEYYKTPDFKKSRIDDLIIEARKLYHRMDDAVSRCIDTTFFEDDETFRKVTFVDFYRYHDVPLESLYSYLDTNAPWIRPSDTGRSTNCRINDAGIYTHKKELGHHNYARPYSWDVRLGHKERDAALVELDDEIDVQDVTTMLNEVGYSSDALKGVDHAKESLVAFYTGKNELDEETIRQPLIGRLPLGAIPSKFIHVPTLPVTSSGKRDYKVLEELAYKSTIEQDTSAPRNEIEQILYECWIESFGFSDFGIYSNFFHIGGDSLTAINISSKATDRGLTVSPHMMISYPTISEIAGEVSRSNAPPQPIDDHLEGSSSEIQTELSSDELDALFADNGFE